MNSGQTKLVESIKIPTPKRLFGTGLKNFLDNISSVLVDS